MLRKDLTPEEISKMYNRVVALMIKDERNDLRITWLLEEVNELRASTGEAPLSLLEFDASMGYDEEGIKRRMLEYFDLDLGGAL